MKNRGRTGPLMFGRTQQMPVDGSHESWVEVVSYCNGGCVIYVEKKYEDVMSEAIIGANAINTNETSRVPGTSFPRCRIWASDKVNMISHDILSELDITRCTRLTERLVSLVTGLLDVEERLESVMSGFASGIASRQVTKLDSFDIICQWFDDSSNHQMLDSMFGVEKK